VFPANWIPRLIVPGLAAREKAAPNRELFIEAWCGMRGIVSLAAALALPVTIQSGAPFPYRDLIIFLTFVVILVTLVGQGLTLAPLIKRLKLSSDESIAEEQRHARTDMGRAAISAVEQIAAQESVSPEVVARVRAEFAERLALAEADSSPGAIEAEQARKLRLAAIKAERASLIKAWQENHISDDVLHHLEEELDYQESRL
jgi:NhaP-type Na+/H+ or K+/H+ antiporter